MVRRIIREVKLTVSEILDVLSKEGEPSQFQARVLDYARKVSKTDPKKARELVERLLKLGDITEEEAVQIVNIMPKTREELRTIFYHRKAIIMEDFLNQILEIIHS